MMDMILECKVSEDSYDENRMDILFGELEQRDPHHPAVLKGGMGENTDGTPFPKKDILPPWFIEKD